MLLAFMNPAAAQQATAPTGVRSVIVTEVNTPQTAPVTVPDLSRYTTDALAVELAGTLKFEVLARKEVVRAAGDLGYRQPYDVVQLGRIARSLGATDIVYGDIAAIRVDRPKDRPRTVRVGLRVAVVDPARGDIVNGAAVVGTAVQKSAADTDEQLAWEAARAATLLAVRDLQSTTLPEGIILNTVGGGGSGLLILINRGHRDGVKVGMEMAVYRNGERMGVIRVTSVMSNTSDAVPVEYTLGYRPMDTVRAIFPMPVLKM
jgi:hypothetical protein